MVLLKGSGVLVTGAAGFVGSSVVRALVRRNARVVCIDNFMHGSESHLRSVSANIEMFRCDIREISILERILAEQRIDYIINCVGDTFVPDAYDSPQRFLDINASGTLAILIATRDVPVKRIVQLSTTEVYGGQLMHRLNEQAALNPQNTYAVSKLAADRLCHTAFLEHGTPVVIARLFNAYGPRETHRYIVPEIISQLVRNSGRLVLGNLDAERDLTYVGDTADALVRLLDPTISNGEVFNVGSDTSFSVRWLAARIAGILNFPDVIIETEASRLRRCDIASFRCDNSKMRLIAGWTPTVGIDDGLRRTIDWYQAHSNAWAWENSTEPARNI